VAAAAYSLGVPAMEWGMQSVKGGLVFRGMAAPLPEGVERPGFDPFPHAVGFLVERGIRRGICRTVGLVRG
jgi:hypothetical protein